MDAVAAKVDEYVYCGENEDEGDYAETANNVVIDNNVDYYEQ